MHPAPTSLLIALAACAAAAEPQTPAPQAWIEELRATNQARAALATEASDWRQEQERLQAVIAGVDAERDRLGKEADEAEQVTKTTDDNLRAIGTGSELDALRAQIVAGAEPARAALATIAKTLPPGAITLAEVPADNLFDEVARALGAAEEAAGGVAVDIVPGSLNGETVAVKVLRVAGTCAWWVSMNGHQAGTVAITDGAVILTPAADEREGRAIARAVAIVEGRHPADVAVLPLKPITVGGMP